MAYKRKKKEYKEVPFDFEHTDKRIRSMVNKYSNYKDFDDVCQYCWLLCMRYWNRHGHSPHPTLVSLMSKHATWNYHRKQKRTADSKTEIWNKTKITMFEPRRLHERGAIEELCVRELKKRTEQERRIFWLKMNGYTLRQIAEMEGITPLRSNQIMSNLILMLRRKLERHPDVKKAVARARKVKKSIDERRKIV